MIIKKIIGSLIFLTFLNGCVQNSALLGPAYTLATSGNIYHAGFTYGSTEIVQKTTGKSTTENIKEMLTTNDQDTEFEKIVKKRIRETRKKLKLDK